MTQYRKKTEKRMQAFYKSLSEKERRRYAAVEADKLGHGGIEYIASLFGLDPKTIRRGLEDLENEETLSETGERKKGEDEKASSNVTRN
jgi:DeoR/GlpR family transcriptional regulator of sugar metabolism